MCYSGYRESGRERISFLALFAFGDANVTARRTDVRLAELKFRAPIGTAEAVPCYKASGTHPVSKGTHPVANGTYLVSNGTHPVSKGRRGDGAPIRSSAHPLANLRLGGWGTVRYASTGSCSHSFERRECEGHPGLLLTTGHWPLSFTTLRSARRGCARWRCRSCP